MLRQIQSFGEAADDEFDVQWATTSMAAKKVTQHIFEDYNLVKFKDDTQDQSPHQQVQPSEHMPIDQAPRKQQTELEESPQPFQQQFQPSQRINPFLDLEDEEGDSVVVEQVVSIFYLHIHI